MTRAAALRTVALLVALLAPAGGARGAFPVLSGDPVDPATGDAYFVLPGLPLILSPPHGERPVVDTTITGDVDLVVRAGTPMVGPGIPAPADSPVTAIAGGTHVADGTEIPFTVVVSDGQTPPALGHPLLGPEMDGLPVVVFAFADLDGDGVVGPTDADPDGAADDAREMQEALYPVGRGLAVFTNGVATGSVAVSAGAPTSAGGLTVVLTAAAYVGPFDPMFGADNIPKGPPVATMLPFIPRTDALSIIEGQGRGGRADGGVRIEIELEPAVPPLVGDRTLGTPFAIPTDGTSPTVDVAVVGSGGFARARFVRPSVAAGFPTGAPIPLHVGAGGALVAPLDVVDLPDDGPGNAVTARLVPVDRLDNVTDPTPGTMVTLVAGSGLTIVAPDTDGDPSRETVALDTAAGVDVTLDDAGGAGDSGPGATLAVETGGFATGTLAVHFTPAAGGTTTSTVAATTSSTSTVSTTTSVAPTSTTLPDTTSSTVVGSSITTSTATSSSTTAPPASTTTTSTTLPPGCAGAPSLTGASCRLTALAADVDAEVPAGALHDRLAGDAAHARTLITDAAQLVGAQQTRSARGVLRRAGGVLADFQARLRSRRARVIAGDARTRLLAEATAVQSELRSLRQGLRG